MRRVLACVVCGVMTVGMVWAERVSEEDAALVANNFMNVTPSSAHGQKAPAKRMVMKAAAAAEENQFYIYENADGEGWVMVAANDVVRPILAYSETGHFRTDNQPSNLKVWLNGYNRLIKRAETDGLVANEETQQEWAALRKGAKIKKATAVVSPLIKTGWDQDSPYWNLCPTKSGTRCLTGCVATAMAQVMNYWQWPKQGTGSHTIPGTSYSADFESTTYDWVNMKNTYSSSTSAQKTAVATLMYHCGVAVDMSYNTSANGGSGAYTIDYNGYFSEQGIMCAEKALTTFFGYNSETVKGYPRDGFTSRGLKKWTKSEWLALLKGELDAARPIMYAGVGCDDESNDDTCYGHSFVCDGYDSSDYFHFNFGWSNSCDGYYDVDVLNTDVPGNGGGNGYYSLEQDVIVGIQPPVTGHAVVTNGTGCTITPSANFANNNEALTATITPTDATYDFTSLTVKLGSTTLTKTTHYTLSSDNKTLTIKASAITGDASNDLIITAVWTKNRYKYDLLGENSDPDADEGMLEKNAALNLTILPASGYTLSDAACWEVTMGGNTLTYGTGFTYEGTTFTIASVTGDVEIYVFGGKQVTWKANGTTFATTMTSSDKYVLPTETPDNDCDGREFYGWCATENYTHETTAPTIIKDGDDATQGNIFYAVFATKGEGGGSSSIEKASSIAVGDEVILVCESKSMELSSFTTSGTIYGNGTAYSETPSGDFSFSVVAGNENGSYAFVRDGKYWNWSSGNSLSTATSLSANTSWAVSFSDGDASITNKSDASRKIQWNAGSPRFACYTSGQTAVQLYKKVGGGSSYTDYTTSCGTPAEKYAINITTPAHGSLTTSPSNEAAAGKTVTVTATADTHYHLATLTVKDASNADVPVSGEGNTRTFTMPEKAVTISATFEEDTKYTINFYVGNSIQRTESLFAGQTATPPSVVAPCEAYTYTSGWVTSAITEETTSAPTTVTDFTVKGAQDYYAVFSRVEEGESGGTTQIEDELTRAITGSTGTSYASWSGKSVNSDAVYAGNSAGGNDAIQLRSNNNNSGIITTASGGKIKKVVVTWNSNTTSGRKIDIYGKNAAYSDATDLYNNSAQGTNLGSIADTQTELTISGDYTYVGVRSNSGALYLDDITFTWEAAGGSSSTTYYTTAPDCSTPEPCELISISLYTKDVKKVFTEGETFSYDGLVVTANYSNCASKDVMPTSVSTPDLSTAGDKTVTVSYTENEITRQKTYSITVKEPNQYTIAFYDNGVQIGDGQVIIEGKQPEVPSDPEPACSAYTFVGWWTAELAKDNTESKAWITDFTATQDQNYYAIYKKTEGSESGPTASVSFKDADQESPIDASLTAGKIREDIVETETGIDSYSGSKVYASPNGAKLGSSKANGQLDIVLSSAVTTNTITINAKQYGTDTGSLSVTVNENTDFGSAQMPSSEGGVLTFTDDEITINSITITTSSKRAYVKSVTIGTGSTSTTYYSSTVSCGGGTDVENASVEQVAVKALMNGQIVIIRGDAVYSITGVRIQ